MQWPLLDDLHLTMGLTIAALTRLGLHVHLKQVTPTERTCPTTCLQTLAPDQVAGQSSGPALPRACAGVRQAE